MGWRESKFMQVVWTIVRVYVGWEWLSAGFEKTFGSGSAAWVGAKAGTAITGFLKGGLAKTAGDHPQVQSWYGWFLSHIALPNATFFSYIIAWGEFLVGVGLIIGCLTTIALFAGILMNLNYLFAGTVSTNAQLLLLEALLLWAGAAAYYWGVDRVFLPRWKKWRLEKG